MAAEVALEEGASAEAEAAEEAVAEAVEEEDSTHVLLSVLYYCHFINKITKKLIILSSIIRREDFITDLLTFKNAERKR